MTEKEALKLALEALEAYRPVIVKRYGLTYSVGDNAITAIREALAQPEQEPVAILHRYPSKCRMTVEYTDEITEVREGSWPLYTTPPQSKPLTDEEIYDMYNEPRSDAEMIAFARTIEAAVQEKQK